MDVGQEEKEVALENEGQIVPILDINDEPALQPNGSPVTWTVCGVNSDKYRDAEAWQRKAYRKLAGREMTKKEHAEHQAEFIARCSLANAGFTLNGEPLPFTTENATIVLTRLPHVRRRIEAAMGDHAGFTKRTSRS